MLNDTESQQTTTPDDAFVFPMYLEDLVANSHNKNNRKAIESI